MSLSADLHQVAVCPDGDVDVDTETLFAVGEDVGGWSLGGQGEADTSDPFGIVAVDALVPKDQLEGTCGVVYHGEGEWPVCLQLTVERTGGLE